MWKTSGTATLLCILAARSVIAVSSWGQACSQNYTHLNPETWALVTDCDATTYCADNGTCAYKGCRTDVYPYGYNGVDFANLPPLCPQGQFCPDEGDACLDQIPVGGQCQKDRDDECQPPSNWRDLAGYLNVNGSTCLNFICYYANVTLGQSCVIENTAYTGYTSSGSTFVYIVSRDNCANGMYCDGTQVQCLRAKSLGASCSGNKECLSYNCQSDGVCGHPADQPIQPASWVYVLVGLGIVGLISTIMVTLWLTHRRTREENRAKLEQYYNEQVAYRRSIMSMSRAKNSIFSLPANTTPDIAKKRLLADTNTGFASSSSLLPPNMVRSDSLTAQSEAADSDILSLDDRLSVERGNRPRYRG